MKWPFAFRKSVEAAGQRLQMANRRATQFYCQAQAKDEVICTLREVMQGLIKSDKAIEHLAAAFADMSDDQQAKFFSVVAEISKTWPKGGLQMNQWHMVGMHENLTEDGAEICREISGMWDHLKDHPKEIKP